MTMKNFNTKATFSIGKTLSSGMHFACKAQEKQESKPCAWNHVEVQPRTGKYSNLSIVAK